MRSIKIEMIKNFKHRGLKRFYKKSDGRLLNSHHLKRLERLLGALDAITEVASLNYQGNYLHELKGQRKGTWSVKVSGNWRLTFHFIDGNAYDVDLEDYH